MKVTATAGDKFDIQLTKEELGLIGNAINEVCNGVHIPDWEFQSPLGHTKDEARALLGQITAAYRVA